MNGDLSRYYEFSIRCSIQQKGIIGRRISFCKAGVVSGATYLCIYASLNSASVFDTNILFPVSGFNILLKPVIFFQLTNFFIYFIYDTFVMIRTFKDKMNFMNNIETSIIRKKFEQNKVCQFRRYI